ncbi:glycosyltransferase family 2 protein [Tepidamorphus sp. 3E244]|uniref:glycosyltransferase family 2 protein n=1 Tax=Tepidamorphus sp. 3E244 TaxID=3385498 RepID=UPI0038FC1189
MPHFRTSLLREAGGWDPYNVTEDADLGVRLARLGFSVGVIDSTTFEEAPAGLIAWTKQRTRWMKGWMQTFLVHMRNPLKLAGDLGPIAGFGFIGTVVANLTAPLLHPAAIGFVIWQARSGIFLAGSDPLTATVAAIASANLVFGYIAALLCAGVGTYRRPMGGLAAHLVLTPFYWLLSAVAFILAAFDLVRRPHFWAKTEHGTARANAPVALRRKRPARVAYR